MASRVAEWRGELAGSLWLVSDWLDDQREGLVSFIDTTELGGGWRLAVASLPTLGPFRGSDSPASMSRWGLVLQRDGETCAACDAPPGLARLAVERLPSFLCAYRKELGQSLSEPALTEGRALRESMLALSQHD